MRPSPRREARACGESSASRRMWRVNRRHGWASFVLLELRKGIPRRQATFTRSRPLDLARSNASSASRISISADSRRR